MGAVCTGGAADGVRSLDSSVAVLPEGGGGKQGKGQNTAGSPLSNGAAAAAAAGSSTFAASVPHHPHSTHYMHFRPDCAGVDDYHTRKRDHSALPQGVLDHEGILAHTDFDIDLSRCDADNDEHFAEYVERRIKFEEQLKILYENTPSQRHQQAATAAGGRATRMTELPLQPLPANITYVRPFLSSTFKDFNEERNIMFAQSFPRLEKLCNERNLFFAPLDLRWGVTSEQSGSGRVISICLDEIDRSRPYFVCSLGFRNGWALMPGDNPQDQYVRLLEKTFELAEAKFEWIKLARDRSVTELEILHGALNDPSLSPRTFFYFRDVSFLSTLPKPSRKLFAEIGESEKRLQQLKTRIVAAGFRVRYFSSAQQMSDLMEEDFRASIEGDFPIQKLTPLDREVKDHQAFAEMRTRVYVGGEKYIQALDQFLLDERLDAPQVCVISGASGAGKSSLLANWMKQVKARAKNNGFAGRKRAPSTSTGEGATANTAGDSEPVSPRPSPSPVPGGEDRASTPAAAAGGVHALHWNTALFQDRYIGSTSDSTQPGTLLRWILTEIKERFEYIEAAVPQDPKKIIDEFPEFLTLASSNSPVLLVLDGLDQLYEEDDAHHLLWLPKDFPKNVKVVLSTVHGSLTHKTMVERAGAGAAAGLAALVDSSGGGGSAASSRSNTMFLSIDNVSDEHCLQLIRTFLGSYGKNLDHAQEERIMACERTRNPLYLITFLHEVRVFGSFENLTRRIDHYMEAGSVAEMFLKVIGRLEEDFETPSVPLVRMTLSLMMVARRGLNEVELRGALELALGVSAHNQTFPSMEFSALMLRLDQQLVDQRGLRKFSHNYLRAAVETKYFTKATSVSVPAASASAADAPAAAAAAGGIGYTSQSFVRKILADYFCALPTASERKVEEAPWHLWTILHESMEQAGGGDDDDEETVRAAAVAAAASGVGGALAQPRKLDLAAIQRELQEQICDLEMFEKLKGDCVYDLHKYWLLLESIRGAQAGKGSKSALSYTAACYSAVLKKWSSSDPRPSPLDIAATAESVGTFLIGTDRYNGAEIFLDQALEIRSQVQGAEHAEVELIISKKANLFYRQGRYDEALPLYLQSLQMVEKNDGDKSVRSSVLRTSIAGLLKEQGKFAESQPLYEKSLEDKIALLGRRHPVVAVSMSNLAELHLRLHHPEQALPLYKESLQIMESERGRSHPEVATIVSSLASCYMQLEKYDDAIKLYERARKIKEELLGANHVSVAVVLNNLAATYQKQGDASKALKLLERSLRIRQAVHGKDSPLTAQTLNNMGDVYLEEKKYRHASSFFAQALDIMEREKGKFHVDLMGTLTSQAKLHYDKAEFEQALPIYVRQLAIMEQNYGPEDERVQQSLNNIGMVHQSMENYSAALPFHLRELLIVRKKYGEKSLRAADVLMILGVLFVSMDRTETGLAVFKRCFVLRREQLGPDAEATLEAKGWIADLAEEEEEAEDDALAKLRLEDVPEPEEINEAAQVAACPPPPRVSATPSPAPGAGGGAGMLLSLPGMGGVGGGAGGGRHAPSKSAMSLPPIGLPLMGGMGGGSFGGAGSVVVSPPGSRTAGHSASSSTLPPIGGHRPTPSMGSLPALPGMGAAAPAPKALNIKPPATLGVPGSTLAPPASDRKKKPSIVFT